MKSSARHPWSVGEVAARFDLPTNVLRHWETVGLLQPARDAAGRRRYGEDEVVRIAVIQRSKAAGMSLEQIGVLLDDGRAGRHQVLQQHLDDLDRRMVEMLRSKAMTEHAMRCSAHDITTCPRFRQGIADVLGRFESRGDGSALGSAVGSAVGSARDAAADSARDAGAGLPGGGASGPSIGSSP